MDGPAPRSAQTTARPRRLDRLGVQRGTGVAAGRLGPRSPGPRSRLARRARAPTIGTACWSSSSSPSSRADPPTFYRRGPSRAPDRPPRRPAARPASLLAFRLPAVGSSLFGGPGRARVQRARRDLPRHGVRMVPARRSGSTASFSSTTCGCRSATTVRTRCDACRRRARGRVGDPRRHGVDQRARPECTRWCERSGVGAASAWGLPGCPRAAGRTAWTLWAGEGPPVLAQPLLGVVLRGEHRTHRRSTHRPRRRRRRNATPTGASGTITQPPSARGGSTAGRRRPPWRGLDA